MGVLLSNSLICARGRVVVAHHVGVEGILGMNFCSGRLWFGSCQKKKYLIWQAVVRLKKYLIWQAVVRLVFETMGRNLAIRKVSSRVVLE